MQQVDPALRSLSVGAFPYRLSRGDCTTLTNFVTIVWMCTFAFWPSELHNVNFLRSFLASLAPLGSTTTNTADLKWVGKLLLSLHEGRVG
jgi:hypothetical protein